MKINKGNIWTYDAIWKVIFTNGYVRNDGCLVMGRGTALQAKNKYPDIAKRCGQFLNNHGNHVGVFEDYKLITFPTKHGWWEDSDLVLIEQSAVELGSLPYNNTFVLGCPGCGCGKLDWSDVKLIIEPILDDRFTVLVGY